jgi:cytochrome c oxidase cbb3-type subunit 3
MPSRPYRHSAHPGLSIALGIILAVTLGATGAAAQAPDGAALFRRHCRACHGAEGVPPAGMAAAFPSLTSLAEPAVTGRAEDSLVQLLQDGRGSMKSFREKLSDEEMRAVARFVKALGPPAGGT